MYITIYLVVMLLSERNFLVIHFVFLVDFCFFANVLNKLPNFCCLNIKLQLSSRINLLVRGKFACDLITYKFMLGHSS